MDKIIIYFFKYLLILFVTFTLTGDASFLIFPHDIASSGLAPLSLPS